MTHEYDQYFEYLMQRSRLGRVCRRHVLYPRLVKRLRGRLLDVGCGIGDLLAFRPDSIGVDINERTVACCHARGHEAHGGVPCVRGWHSDPDHKVIYDQASLVDRVCKAGFEEAEVFHTPLFRSAWLSGRVRQYCIYGAFDRA